MKLKINSIDGQGDLANEVVWIEVAEDTNLEFFMLSDTTYTDDNHISNEVRHTFWLPGHEAKKGDWIAIRTKDGSYQKTVNKQGTSTHNCYMKLGRTIWNKDGDCAVLFYVPAWTTMRAVAQRKRAA